jgi:hypothetical protein
MGEVIERVTGKPAFDPQSLNGLTNGSPSSAVPWTTRLLGATAKSFAILKRARANGRLRLIKQDVFTEHRDRLLALGCSPTSANHAFKTLSGVFQAACKDKLIETNVAKLKTLSAEAAGAVQVGELDQLIAKLETDRSRGAGRCKSAWSSAPPFQPETLSESKPVVTNNT